MVAVWVGVFIPLLLAGVVGPASCFKAAVFEHAQQSHVNASYTPEEIVQKNLQFYARAALFAASKGVDVIVFPEYGLFPPIASRTRLKRFLEYVPDPRGGAPANPCRDPDAYGEHRPILYTLSCLARTAGLIVVANMGDLQPCRGERGCPGDGAFHFNTNVVFGRDGRIVAKYHKEHLFDEAGMDVPPPGQDPTFVTDLGRFATFVCFDIVFGRMAEVSRRGDVRAVLFPTMWLNSGPLFNAPQYFESWAVGNDVTLLAANVHLPGHASLGSVVVQGRRGALVYSFNPDGHSKLLLADLGHSECSAGPSIYVLSEEGFEEWTDDGRDVGAVCSEKVLRPAKDLYKEYRCLERNTAYFTLERLVSPSGHLEACHGGVCCTLDYEADELRGDHYLGVFNGTYDAARRYSFAEEDCFVARCDALDGRPCATFPTRSDASFRRVRMRANFSTDFLYPSVVESGMRLAPKDRWKFEKRGHVGEISLRDASGKPLLVVGIKARPYSRDPPYVR